MADDIATCIYDTMARRVHRSGCSTSAWQVCAIVNDCRAVLQFFKPENAFDVGKALMAASRQMIRPDRAAMP